MATVTETIEVSGIRCERCMARLAHVLNEHAGLKSANATLTGQVTLVFDDTATSREALLGAMQRGGFRLQSERPESRESHARDRR
jgi:copper chaperone CopZ